MALRTRIALAILFPAMVCLNVMGFFLRGKIFRLGCPFSFGKWALPLEYEMPNIVFGPFDVFGYILTEFSFFWLAIDLVVCFGIPISIALWESRRMVHRQGLAKSGAQTP